MKWIRIKINNGDYLFKLILAPMAGYTDRAFREIASEFGADETISEMVSCKGITFKDKKTLSLLEKYPGENNLSVQIFAGDKESVISACQILKSFDFKSININMGCPAPKIVKSNQGSYLIKKPDLVYDLVRAAVLNSNLDVSIKIRKSFEGIFSIDAIKAAEEAGASGIILHARSREEYYRGENDWDYIKKIKGLIKIPLIGNGDILSVKDAKEKIEYSGVDGLAIGRGTIGNPYIFRDIKANLKGQEISHPTKEERLDLLLRHLNLSIKYKGERLGILTMRKSYAYYFKNMENSKELRTKLNTENDYREIVKIIEDYRGL